MASVICAYHWCRYNENRICAASRILLLDEEYDGMRCDTYKFSLAKEKEIENRGKEQEAISRTP